MHYLGAVIFVLASIVLGIGVIENMGDSPRASIGSTGTMAMNSYYMLATALYAAATAAALIWGRNQA